MTQTAPNVLFIVLDTQRRDRLSLYGYDRTTSPAFDNFAQDATVFDRAIAPAQWTVPAHGSLFTGLYPSQHHLTQAFDGLSGVHPTLAELLQVADYRTVAFCNNPLVGVLNNGLQRGFDEFYNYAGASPNRPRERKGGIIREFEARFSRFARQLTNRFAHSDTLFRLGLNPLITPIWTRLANYKGHTAHSLQDLQTYWQRHTKTSPKHPLFAYVNLMGTHMPLRPSASTLDRIAPDVRRSPASQRWMAQHNADGVGWISPIESPLEDWQTHTLNAYYDASIIEQDALLGQALDALKKTGALDNTLVIIGADHGEGHGDHNYFGHSFVVYQELVHVPLIVRYPDHFPQKRIAQNVSTRRIFHTILDVAGVKTPFAPDDPNGRIKELSLMSALNGKPDSEGGIAFSEAYPPVNLLNIMTGKRAPFVEKLRLNQVRRGVYHGDYKLATAGTDGQEVFNVAQDPTEASNIAPQDAPLTAQLQGHLNDFVASIAHHNAPHHASQGYSDEVLENLRALGYLD